jgi:hypothetical protein
MQMNDVVQFDPHLGLVGVAGLRPSALAVVDTSFILDRAAEQIRDPRANIKTLGVGSVRLFAPTRVANELVWNYESAARRRGVDPAALHTMVWQEFAPKIRFVDLPRVDVLNDTRLRDLGGMDADDLDLGRLGLLLAPCHVYSHDKHLRISGFAPPTIEDLDAVLAAGLAVEVSDGALVTTGFVVRLGARGASGAANAVAVRLQVPIWVVALVVGILIGGLVTWAMSSPERRAKADVALAKTIAIAGELAERRLTGQALLERTSIPAPVPSAETRILRALALARSPLLASEVEAVLLVDGNTPSVAWIRQFLARHPACVKVGRYRWQLGRQMALVTHAS